jgi:hypothetical protein
MSVFQFERRGFVVLVSDLIRGFLSPGARIKPVRKIEHHAVNRPDILIGVNDTGWNQHGHGILFAGFKPVLVFKRRRIGAIIPEIDAKGRRAGEGEAIGLLSVFMWPAGHTRSCHGNVAHGRSISFGKLVLPEKLDQPSALVGVSLESANDDPVDAALDVYYGLLMLLRYSLIACL